jgi:hypothetical protein
MLPLSVPLIPSFAHSIYFFEPPPFLNNIFQIDLLGIFWIDLYTLHGIS